jgi:hypothetical protein
MAPQQHSAPPASTMSATDTITMVAYRWLHVSNGHNNDGCAAASFNSAASPAAAAAAAAAVADADEDEDDEDDLATPAAGVNQCRA